MARTPLCLAFPLLAALAAAPAEGASTLEARYVVTFTGVTIGQGALVVEVNEEGYSAAGSAMVAGLLRPAAGVERYKTAVPMQGCGQRLRACRHLRGDGFPTGRYCRERF